MEEKEGRKEGKGKAVEKQALLPGSVTAFCSGL